MNNRVPVLIIEFIVDVVVIPESRIVEHGGRVRSFEPRFGCLARVVEQSQLEVGSDIPQLNRRANSREKHAN